MREIRKVSIIGLGALGILFGKQLSKKMPNGDLRIVADRERILKYENENVYCNGEACHFLYVTPEAECEPADLLIFAVKSSGLHDAIEAVKNHVGKNTIILSLLNGITSERIIGQTYGTNKVLFSVAQGMDAVKVGNQLSYDHLGMIVFGEKEPGFISDRVKVVGEFFEKMGVPFHIDKHMDKRQWGKFMLNVGVNQTVAVFRSDYGEIQKKGEAREMMISAMREVMLLSEKEGINLTENDLDYWLEVLGTLSPAGKPSMAQDLEAKRCSEVELFAGTVMELGKKHGVPTPVNKELYKKIKEIERTF